MQLTFHEDFSCTLEQQARVQLFYSILLRENEKQNLTRLTSPDDFIDGHLIDVLELQKSSFIADSKRVLDLGSGCGVPGLLSAVLSGAGVSAGWILVDSEKRKAEYLKRAAVELGFTSEQVDVVSGRAEDYLRDYQVDAVVARAVGTVTKIYSILAACSTWNTLILFKGPGWVSEWEEFEHNGKTRGRLQVVGTHAYSVADNQKQRVIIQLSRVPRGTSK